MGVLTGVFGKKRVFGVVFWWCGCGVLRGGRGELAACFWAANNAPCFRTIFS
jgi:hypothetical protein